MSKITKIELSKCCDAPLVTDFDMEKILYWSELAEAPLFCEVCGNGQEDEQCHNCGYETDTDSLDTNGYCQNCQNAYETGHDTGFMSALQRLASVNPAELSNLDKITGNERYALFARLLSD